MLLKTWLSDWLTLRTPKLKPRTVESYRYLIENHINPRLGSVDLSELSALQVSSALARISAAGHSRTAEMCFVLLRSALRKAAPQVMPDVERPQHEQKSPPAWSDAAIAAYLHGLNGHRHELALTLTLVLGLRRGEICGLRWEDFDFRNGLIHIVNQRQRLADGSLVDLSPKSKSSIRDLPIPEALLPLLRQRRQIAGYLCSISPSGLDAAHRALVLKLQLPYTTLHGLRHSMATSCIRHGGEMKSLQLLLGHRDYSTTANRYTQPDVDMLRKCLDSGSVMCYTVIQ